MVYYNPIKITNNTLALAKIIINIVIWYHDYLDLIITYKDLFLTLSFDHGFAIFLVSNNSFLLYLISKLINKASSKTVW